MEDIRKGRVMKRLGIFVFYDKEGIVDLYIDFLIRDLKSILSYLIVVVNGEINSSGYQIFEKYANEIVIRENIGFDIGAYKIILQNLHRRNELEKWDEVVFCNDTFYGPFIPFNQIFEEMEKRKVDFWGLNYIDNNFLSHIQSYFLVFGKNILLDGQLLKYIEEKVDPNIEDLTEIYAVFEVGIFVYLRKLGYKYDVYTYTENYSIYECADICIEKFQLPILKKKCFSAKYYNKKNLEQLLQFIKLERKYDISHIISNIYRLYGVEINNDVDLYCNNIIDISQRKRIPKCIEEKKLMDFFRTHPYIYIYGTGVFAKHIWIQFHEYIKNFMGFIISDNQTIGNKKLYDYPIMHYKNVEKGKAIIVALGLKNSREVYSGLKSEDEILFLWNER